MPTFAVKWSASGPSAMPRQSAVATAGDRITLNFTQYLGTTDLTAATFTARLIMYPDGGVLQTWTDSAFTSKTSGGAFTFSIVPGDLDDYPNRCYMLETSRTDTGNEATIAEVLLTLNANGTAVAYVPVLGAQPLNANLTAIAGASAPTTIGLNFLTLTNPSAITFPRINANNTVSALSAAAFLSAIGAGTSSFSGSYTDLTNKPTLGTAAAQDTSAFDAAGAAAAATASACQRASNLSDVANAATALSNLGGVGTSTRLDQFAAATAQLSVTTSKPANVGTTPATAGTSPLSLTCAAGGDTTISTTGVGGIGAGFSWTTGAGGVASSAATSSTGGAGGPLAITTGAGGDGATGTAASVGGASGATTLTQGVGGAASGGSTSNAGGGGGTWAIALGTGGAATATGSATAQGGNGSAWTIGSGSAGKGGAATTSGMSGTPIVKGGVGGAITITAKGGGAASNGYTTTGGAASTVSIGSAIGGAATGGTGTNTTAGGKGSTFALNAGLGGAASGTSATSATGGAGGDFSFISGGGGAASGSSGTNIGGRAGTFTFRLGAAGTGATSNGAAGSFSFNDSADVNLAYISPYTSTLGDSDTNVAFSWGPDAPGGGNLLSFYGVTKVARQLFATGTGKTVDQLITALQNLGLLRQS